MNFTPNSGKLKITAKKRAFYTLSRGFLSADSVHADEEEGVRVMAAEVHGLPPPAMALSSQGNPLRKACGPPPPPP